MSNPSLTRRGPSAARSPAARLLRRAAAALAVAAVALSPAPASADPIDGFAPAARGTTVGADAKAGDAATAAIAGGAGAAEQVRTIFPDDGVRAVVCAPADFAPAKQTLLVVFALPNGNTIEQSAGCRPAPALDWHFDIQHVGAQVRRLRQLEAGPAGAGRNVVVAYVGADTLSWPAWRAKRPDAPKRVAAVVDAVVRTLPPPPAGVGPARVALTCHSGGGAFLLSYLDAAAAVPDAVERFVFLDANYSYNDPEKDHGGKLLRWLGGDPSRHLVVVAYDDREVTIDGKKVVSDTGGTWRASMRMVERFAKDTPLTTTTVTATPGTTPATGAAAAAVEDRSEPTAGAGPASRGATAPAAGPSAAPVGPPPVTRINGLQGQIRFLLHRNPEVKILHTRLVELNGLVAAMTLGTPSEAGWGGTFFGPRAYDPLVQPLPSVPARSPTASPAVDVAAAVKNSPIEKREQVVAAEVLRGNFPPAWRSTKRVTLSAEVDGVRHACVVEVMPDVLAVGGDADPLRVPLTPTTAMKIATQLGCVLPTRKIVDAVDAAADVRLDPRPLTEAREAFSTFVQHNAIVEEQVAAERRAAERPAGRAGDRPPGRLGLVTGAKKDVVISNRLPPAGQPPKVAIYGWRKLDGNPIQPLTTVHKEVYVDYSHGVRLVSRVVTVDGQEQLIEDVLKDPKLHVLLSDEGPVESPAAYYRR
jgi:hypothetical protein